MKKKEWNEGMNCLDYDLVESYTRQKDALRQKNKKNSGVWLRFGALAACLLLIVGAVIAVPLLRSGEDPFLMGGNPNTDYSGELQLEKYYDYGIDTGTFSSYVGGNVISKDRIGNKIESVVVTAGWKNEAGDWMGTESLNAEVYAINGVESDVAAALKFLERGEAVTTTHYYVILHPNAEYNGKLFPDYKADNPVRYLEETDMGQSNGWQDFGISGEIRTITVPVGSTYIYQMYSQYIRNDLTHMYAEDELPDTLEDLPAWLSDTAMVGRKSFWYSMGGRIPHQVSLEAATTIFTDDTKTCFIKAEYKVQVEEASGEKEESWVIYFMEEDGIYSAFAVVANENFEFVRSYSETIIKSYQKKQ